MPKTKTNEQHKRFSSVFTFDFDQVFACWEFNYSILPIAKHLPVEMLKYWNNWSRWDYKVSAARPLHTSVKNNPWLPISLDLL